jgi:hypothetical protein
VQPDPQLRQDELDVLAVQRLADLDQLFAKKRAHCLECFRECHDDKFLQIEFTPRGEIKNGL